MSAQALSVISEIWNIVSDHIPVDDASVIAENVVSILLDHDIDIEDIKYEFSNDENIMAAVKYYGEFADTEDEEYEDYDSLVDREDEDEEW
jgi:hypothetical protein